MFCVSSYTMDDRLPAMDKLNESNWPVWKLQIIAFLEARDLWNMCTGVECEPEPP